MFRKEPISCVSRISLPIAMIHLVAMIGISLADRVNFMYFP